ncbi:uncharacterized protein LOC129616777 [Condylostylus longicornis]|uniref:uncharacterized protein LOC129616777 n=1 Tax=Condylostylus longicornis TaxID=2530218 RepID=UPI00244DE72A|nr:uncharacterized protein LOC129616777 [Condylostylus longicornis]
MPIKKRDDYIPVKCEGWNGKFTHVPGATVDISMGAKIRRHNHAITDPRNFFPFQTKVNKLPVKLSGITPEDVPAREPIIMPPLQWETESQVDPNEMKNILNNNN